MIEAWWEPNQAFMVGGGFTRTAWGFHRYPWANLQSVTLLYSTGYNNVRASYAGQWRLSDTSLVASLNMRFSGIENRNFYGFGNETPNPDDKKLTMTETNEYSVFPAIGYRPSFKFEIHVGAQAKVVQTKGGDSLVEQSQRLRQREVRRGGRARRLRVRLAGPHAQHDRAARHGGAGRDAPPRRRRRSTAFGSRPRRSTCRRPGT